jgi:ligand-binding SRPBCC domain-containing protein
LATNNFDESCAGGENCATAAEVKRILFVTPFVFSRSTVLDTSVEAAFAFHENPANLREISPASLRIISIECERHAVTGGHFTVEVVQFGIRILWRGKWETVRRPFLLVDGAESSPFTFWRHHHIFDREGDRCRMTDRVEFVPPFGRPGRIAAPLVSRLVLGPMFKARHEATRRFFRRPSAIAG